MLLVVLFLLCQATMPRQILNNAYQAEFERRCTKTLPNGKRLTVSQKGVVARDSDGREVEEERVPGEKGEEIAVVATIHDPVETKNGIVDRRSNTVLMIPPVYALIVDVGDIGLALPIGSVPEGGDDLGDRLIEGVTCVGRYYSRPSGNMECWFSQELDALVLIRVVTDTSETIFRVYNIRRVEPDHSLFALP